VTKTLRVILGILVLIGVAWGGSRYRTNTKTVGTEATYSGGVETLKVPLLGIAGTLAFLSGVGLLVMNRK
jgi:hypothetical protein